MKTCKFLKKAAPKIHIKGTTAVTILSFKAGFSLGISPPPPVEDPDRFYRSGEKKYR